MNLGMVGFFFRFWELLWLVLAGSLLLIYLTMTWAVVSWNLFEGFSIFWNSWEILAKYLSRFLIFARKSFFCRGRRARIPFLLWILLLLELYKKCSANKNFDKYFVLRLTGVYFYPYLNIYGIDSSILRKKHSFRQTSRPVFQFFSPWIHTLLWKP